ncbi:MAG: aspartate-semialdehyde dehydrogenase [Candidatus Aegiribacteria sp.]|nr:aspartate-semialdehyde dehydrogenase [Candidatus Aegiribacteria sp.]MBD3294165.1 aspartate-semialdehyde dehydrogenase [Candidatus Fermentibacteria bacterium]
MAAVGIVGATGLVGRTIAKVLQDRSFPVSSFHPFASGRSRGDTVLFQQRRHRLEIIRPESIIKGMILFGATSENIAKKWVNMSRCKGAVVIDNSSAFRMDPDVLLAVPEVNGGRITGRETLIANPNCSTIQLVVALNPLLELGEIRWISVSTYQAVSGAGSPALNDLEEQQKGRSSLPPEERIHRNIRTSIGLPQDNGYCREESKLMEETCKIMEQDFPVFASTARVPVVTGHTEAVTVKFDRDVEVEEAVSLLETAPGVELSQSGASPVMVEETDTVIVDRIRSHPREKDVLQFWVLADNLRKGAALNAVQIAEEYISKK